MKRRWSPGSTLSPNFSSCPPPPLTTTLPLPLTRLLPLSLTLPLPLPLPLNLHPNPNQASRCLAGWVLPTRLYVVSPSAGVA